MIIKEKIKNKYYIDERDKVTKIRIIIDYQIKSLKIYLNIVNVLNI